MPAVETKMPAVETKVFAVETKVSAVETKVSTDETKVSSEETLVSRKIGTETFYRSMLSRHKLKMDPSSKQYPWPIG